MSSLIFVRHGRTVLSDSTEPRRTATRAQEEDAPLALGEIERASRLRAVLVDRGFEPQYVLTSSWRHAKQTASAIAAGSACIIPAIALTPFTDESLFSLESLRNEGSKAGIEWDRVDCVALIGHETRLKQLAQMVTGKEVEKLRRLEAGIVSGGSCLDMLLRCAETTREVVGPPE